MPWGQPVTPANRNYVWTQIVVDELARSGLRAVVIAPGSRSTPLAIAFAEHPDIAVYSIIDERSAAFFALGHALATDRPVAVVCSSGTATANFYPAIIEARYSGVPLLILTADRPPELRDSGANQTVDQVKLYGDHVLWAVDVALPEADPSSLAIRGLRTLACRAYATANGGATSGGGALPRGAVHLNFPFRKPLEPIPVPTDKTDDPAWIGRAGGQPFVHISSAAPTPTIDQIETLIQTLQDARRPLVIVGSQPAPTFGDELAAFAGQTHVPVLADSLAQIRYSAHWSEMEARPIGGYDTFLRGAAAWDKPDLILRFGAMPTSQTLIDYLNANGDAYQIGVSADGVWRDPNHQLDELIAADPIEIARILAQTAAEIALGDQTWADRFHAAESETWTHITDELQNGAFFDGVVVTETVDLIPDGANLYIGNSLPVRHLDQFARPAAKTIRVFGNRGASGIDGTVSSALGAAAGSNTPLVLITGDLGFYHDMNGLLTVKRHGVNAIIVVINNDGGGIFQRLPIAQFDPPYTELFRTPHGLTFDHAAALYGLDYARATDRTTFRAAFNAALTALPTRSTIIEVPTDALHDLQRRNAITQRVLDAIKAL
jgi:2-succinyl-5-enolpyruvyl-6-hydroxy-3-cyclohexene-1-carboxylate synthase